MRSFLKKQRGFRMRWFESDADVRDCHGGLECVGVSGCENCECTRSREAMVHMSKNLYKMFDQYRWYGFIILNNVGDRVIESRERDVFSC